MYRPNLESEVTEIEYYLMDDGVRPWLLGFIHRRHIAAQC